MALEPHGPDTFVGVSSTTPWGRVYGGQVVAQALRAAAATVDPDFGVHSLHAYFIRGGDLSEPIRFEVDRLRNGRSFVTRQIVARQSTGAILNLSASFQVAEAEVDRQVPDPPSPIASPDECTERDTWSPILDIRRTPESSPGHSITWLRLAEEIGDDPTLQSCGFAYLSDDTPMSASRTLHPAHRPKDFDAFIDASLDHSIWFHRPVRADDWQLHEFDGYGLIGGRGLSIGRVFDPSGVHVATVAQEVLLRVNTRR